MNNNHSGQDGEKFQQDKLSNGLSEIRKKKIDKKFPVFFNFC